METYLAKFRFTTGTQEEHFEQFIVKANDLNAAYTIAQDWFKDSYPESAMISLVVHPAIQETVTA